jgi:hypothetical protein
VGAIFSTKQDPKPVLAGLAIGPLVGVAAGAIALPRLRQRSKDGPVPVEKQVEKEVAARECKPSRASVEESALAAALRGAKDAVRIAEWQPLVGAMPMPGNTSRSTFVIGVNGRWW